LNGSIPKYYIAGTTVTVNDRMQQGYVYQRTEPEGRNFDARFKPQLTPGEMLAMGVFGGKYISDCRGEFPPAWLVPVVLPLLHGPPPCGR